MLSCRDLFAAGNGSLLGTIVITSGCAALQPWAAAVGGIVGGLIYLPSSLFMLHVLKIDDPVDAFTVRPSTRTKRPLSRFVKSKVVLPLLGSCGCHVFHLLCCKLYTSECMV